MTQAQIIKKKLPDFEWPPAPTSGEGRKVLFINPPSLPYTHVVKALADISTDLYQATALPMGLLYLSVVLEQTLPGIEIRIVDLAKVIVDYTANHQRTEMTLEEFTAMVLEQQVPADFIPDFVGISILFSTAHKSSCQIATATKKRWAASPIIVGGMHASNAIEALLEMPVIDYVCRGEAEGVITKFAEAVNSRTDCETIQGIYGRKKVSAMIAAGEKLKESAPLIYDLDLIPYPAWHLLPMESYLTGKFSRASKIGATEQGREVTIVTTRGCPFHCTFCASWTVHGREMRYRSNENIIKEMEILHEKYSVTDIIPEDDLFTVKKPRILSLCDSIEKRFGHSLQFHSTAGLCVMTIDEDVIKALVKIGMRIATIAVESGSEYVQKHIIKKNCDLDRARKVVQISRDHCEFVRVYFIVGFPGETREQMMETFSYSASLSSDWNVYMVAAPLIGTEMYEQLLERGYIDESFNWDEAFFRERNFDTDEISAEELKNIAYEANILNNFFNNYNLRIGDYSRAITMYNYILADYPQHIAAHYCSAIAYKKMGKTKEYEDTLKLCVDLLSAKEETMAHGIYKKFSELFTDLNEIPKIRELFGYTDV